MIQRDSRGYLEIHNNVSNLTIGNIGLEHHLYHHFKWVYMRLCGHFCASNMGCCLCTRKVSKDLSCNICNRR